MQHLRSTLTDSTERDEIRLVLASFLTQEAGKLFKSGSVDCASTVDRWVQLQCGFSPFDRLGRRYANEAEARAWLAEPGGLAVATNRILRKAGLKKTADPKQGDIGLILHGNLLCVAIFTGELWIARTETGFVASRHCWKAWAL